MAISASYSYSVCRLGYPGVVPVIIWGASSLTNKCVIKTVGMSEARLHLQILKCRYMSRDRPSTKGHS